MNYRIFFISFFLLVFRVISIHGQISVTLGYSQGTANFNTNVPVFIGKPAEAGFSTVEFSKQFPASKIPAEELKVNFPDMSKAIDTVGILWYLKPENYSPKGEVNIVLIGIGPDSSKTFYIDNNNDRIFADNEESFVFNRDVEKRILEIKILGGYYKYTLMNPDYVTPLEPPSRLGFFNDAWRNSARKPALIADLSFVTGGGKAEIIIKPIVPNITSYRYAANIFGCFRPTLGLGFSWYNVHVDFAGSFELLQYESTVRYDFSDKFKTKRNYDIGWWTRTKYHGTISAEYDIRIFNAVCLSPYAAYSFDKNIDDRRFEKTIDPNTLPPGTSYKDMYSEEAGFKIKVPTSERGLAYIKAGYSRSWFDATDYLPEFEPGSYEVDYHQIYFAIGMQVRLTR